ncbi:MAG: BMP family ABC transporter substrate-binding protein [Bacilli bacterium]|mgnify:CR=1 FL=1|nr:BMP family ABC transporter substrate-binding protein [Bacilli bacterium]
MKKTILCLASLLTMGVLASCGGTTPSDNLKFGLMTLHDSNSTYDKNFIDGFNAACKAKGVTAVVKSGVEEDATVLTAADEMIEDGCKMLFADSFGHESFLLEAAKQNPDVQFYHATGTLAHTANVANFHDAFASIYEGRYLAGIAAGMKLKAMKEADAKVASKIGYVGAWPYAEVKSGYTSFYLGVKSIVEDVTMDVTFTNSWYDEVKEKSSAEALIAGGAVLISQHADSWGAPTACEEKGVPNVTYNGSTESKCPNTYLISSRINWQPYFEHCIDQYRAGKNVETDFTGTMDDGSVELADLGKKCAVEGTAEAIEAAKAKLKDGSLKVFDCSKFTVEGKHLTSYKADVNTDEAFTPDTEVIKTEGGITYFAESEFRSAPYFDIDIDGINILK